MKMPYQTAILRYVHDVVSGEYMNIGVIVYSQEAAFFEAKIHHNYGRLSQAFLGFDTSRYKHFVTQLEREFGKITSLLSGHTEKLNFEELPLSASKLIRRVIPPDETSFQVHEAGGGLSSNLSAALTSAYDRYVMANVDTKNRSRKKDEDVWKSFTDIFKDETVLRKFESKSISTPEIDIEFKHCWQNGKLHAYQPLTLDFVETNSIEDKICKWYGKLSAIANNHQDVMVYLLVGMPEDKDMQAKALRRLQLIDGNQQLSNLSKIVFEEEQSIFAQEVQREIIEYEAKA